MDTLQPRIFITALSAVLICSLCIFICVAIIVEGVQKGDSEAVASFGLILFAIIFSFLISMRFVYDAKKRYKLKSRIYELAMLFFTSLFIGSANLCGAINDSSQPLFMQSTVFLLISAFIFARLICRIRTCCAFSKIDHRNYDVLSQK